ncbi:hypothetical protein [Mycolicibacterium sp. S2-37]|uniref:hypothetical protein n=1 Tax=Mycolicibacterium sp. S2-37 TaxID=2810297 RepID=UPI001F5F49C5|nr:hypothetical protein [Mycolicibacterium sp. S2-37]
MIAALLSNQPVMNDSPTARGRSLCTISRMAGTTVKGDSATTAANAVSSPSNDAQWADVDIVVLHRPVECP